MEIIERILKAEREAAEIKRRAEREAGRILTLAQEDCEAARSVSRRAKGNDREFLERLALRKREWETRAGSDAELRKKSASARLESAADYIVDAITGMGGFAVQTSAGSEKTP